MQATYFDEMGDTGHCIITAAIRDVYEATKLTRTNHAFRAAVHSRITTLRDQFGDEEEDRKELPRSARQRRALSRAFAAKDHKVDPQHAKSLLKRFLEERTAFEPLRKFLREIESGEGTPEQLGAILDETQSRIKAVSALDEKPLISFGEEWVEHNKRLQQFHGKKMIGLKTGLKELDDRTLVTASRSLRPSRGPEKTTYTLQIASESASKSRTTIRWSCF